MSTGDTRNESKRVEAEVVASGAVATAAPVNAAPTMPVDLVSLRAAIKEIDVTRVERSRIPVVNGELIPDDFDGVCRLGRWAFATGMCPDGIENEAQAMLVIGTGAAIGIGAVQSLASIMVVNNKCAIYGDVGVALLRSSGKCGGIKSWMEGNDKQDRVTEKSVAWVEITRLHPGGEPEIIKRGFGVEDAKLAGLWNKKTKFGKDTPWVTSPKRMLHWRAFWYAARDGFADVLKGMGGLEEVRDYEPIDNAADPARPKRTSQRPAAEVNLSNLPQAPARKGDKAPESAPIHGEALHQS